MTDIRARLLAAFEVERAEHLAAMRGALEQARDGLSIDLRDLFRRAHSLKGAARAVELPAVESQAHALESLLAEVEDGRRALDAPTIARVEAGLDAIENDGAAGAQAPDAAPPADRAALRVTAQDLDRVARSIGGVGAALAPRLAARDELAGIADALHRLAADGPAAIVSGDLAREARRLNGIVRRLAADDAAAAQAIERLDGDARAISVASASELVAGLERMVRELAAAAGKQARLTIEGKDAEADRRVLQALRDPLIHLLRNAIAHGAETPAARAAAGKPAEMRIALTIERRGGDLAVIVEDDGRGLDRGGIARAAGVEGALPDDDALFARLFDQGFSTAGAVDAIAGRGVGLAVVAEAARMLGGSARIAAAPETGGARAEIRVPGTIVRQAVLLVEAGGRRFGIIGRQVAHLVQLGREAIVQVGGELRAALPGGDSAEPARVIVLAAAIGSGAELPAGIVNALVLRDAARPTALLVDALVSIDRCLIRGPDEIALASPIVTGAVLLPGGEVVAILDPAAIAGRGMPAAPLATVAPAQPAATAAATILVVDDSVTTRTLQRSILEAQGYRVLLAVDGVAALEVLRARLGEIALVVADVEMPRLDGFGLLHGLRNDPALANIPVIMMTSRNSPDDIRRGFDLGASAYVTKQEFDQGRLLETVARFV